MAAVLPSFVLSKACLRLVGALDGVCSLTNGFLGGFLSLRRFSPAPPPFIVAGALLLFAISLAWERRAVRRTGATLLLVPLLWSLALLAERREVAVPEIDVLDVGQGDAILLRSGRKTLLLDGGGHGIDPRFGRSTLIPMLVDRGVISIDAVALSHPHPDHCGGLIAVLSDLPVGELWIVPRHLREPCGRRLLDEAMAGQVMLVPLATGRRMHLGAFSLNPIVPTITFKRSTLNNSSVVFQAATGRRNVLLTGDAENDAEQWLLDGHFDLHADILKVGHHGSRTSTGQPFLEAVHPRISVISCGRHNPFGHPGASVIAALHRAGAQVYRTDREGTISILCGNRMTVRRQIDTPR
jgi:competence protein ComEC